MAVLKVITYLKPNPENFSLLFLLYCFALLTHFMSLTEQMAKFKTKPNCAKTRNTFFRAILCQNIFTNLCPCLFLQQKMIEMKHVQTY